MPSSFLGVEVPISTAPAALTTDTYLTTGASSGWTANTDPYSSPGKLTFKPSPDETEVGDQSLTFSIESVPINTQPGIVTVICIEGSQDCNDAADCPTVTLTLTKLPNGWGEVEFLVDPANSPPPANPSLIWSGGASDASYVLKWDGQSAELPGGGDGSYPAQAANDPPLNLQADTTFTLAVTGDDYTYTQQVTVHPNPTVSSFTTTAQDPEVDPSSNGNLLSPTVQLDWVLQCADSFELTEQFGDADPLPVSVQSGSTNCKVYPNYGTTAYTITAFKENTPSEPKTILTTTYVPVPEFQGWVSANGDIPSGSGNFSVSRPTTGTQTGRYVVAFHNSVPIAPVVTVTVTNGNAAGGGGHVTGVNLFDVSTSGFSVIMRSTNTHKPYDHDFMFSVFVPSPT